MKAPTEAAAPEVVCVARGRQCAVARCGHGGYHLRVGPVTVLVSLDLLHELAGVLSEASFTAQARAGAPRH
jgi:hypothetical protein